MRKLEAWLPVFLYTALIFTLSSIPNLTGPGIEAGGDKVLHFGEYFLWGLLVRRALDPPARSRGVALAVVLTGAVLAFSDESFQRTVGRDYSYYDMAADVTGATLAQVAAPFLARLAGGAGGGE